MKGFFVYFLILQCIHSLPIDDLHRVFGNSIQLEVRGTGNAMDLHCPENTVIIWGYHYHYSDVYSSCLLNSNKHCVVGASSCSIPACSTSGTDASGILITCGSTVVENSIAISLTSSNTGVSSTLSCGTGNKLLISFQYQFGDYSSTRNLCHEDNIGSCNVGSQSCSSRSCSMTNGYLFMFGLCAPDKFGNMYVTGELEFQGLFKFNSGSIDTLSCDASDPALLTGTTYGIKQAWGANYLSKIVASNNMCNYQNESGTGHCSIGNFGSGNNFDRYGFIVLMCGIRPTTPLPTPQPTAIPTTSPSPNPIMEPVTTPPTPEPTSTPTTTNETPKPTSSPTTTNETNPPTMVNPSSNSTEPPTYAPLEESNSSGLLIGMLAGVAISTTLGGFVYLKSRKKPRNSLSLINMSHFNPKNSSNPHFRKHNNNETESSIIKRLAVANGTNEGHTDHSISQKKMYASTTTSTGSNLSMFSSMDESNRESTFSTNSLGNSFNREDIVSVSHIDV